MKSILAVVLLAILMVGCDNRVKPIPTFEISEIVKSGLGGHRGQVIKIYCTKYAEVCQYKVRFVANTDTTHTAWLGADGDITTGPFATLWMYPYELEKVYND